MVNFLSGYFIEEYFYISAIYSNSMKSFLCSVLLLGSFLTYGQYDDANSHIGISGGYSQLNILTDNFKVTPKGGFNAGFTTRGMLYNKFDLVYGMDFSQASVSIPASWKTSPRVDEIEYKMTSVQIHLQGSYRAISDHLNFDLGPVIQINDKLKMDDKYNNHTLVGTPINASDLTDISKLNFFMGAGITGGTMHVRASIFYMYGLNNLFSKTNKSENLQNAGISLKGNMSLLTAKVIFYL